LLFSVTVVAVSQVAWALPGPAPAADESPRTVAGEPRAQTQDPAGIDLQKAPRRTPSPVVSDERAATVIAYINLACNGRGHMARARRGSRRRHDSIDLSNQTASRLPAYAKATLPQLRSIRLERALH
jgi:hypothetical protein